MNVKNIADHYVLQLFAKVAQVNMGARSVDRLGTMVLLFLVVSCLLSACSPNIEGSKLSIEDQYEITLERRSDLGKLEEDLVDAMGRSLWDVGLPSGEAQTVSCASGSPDDFLFKRPRNTPKQSHPYRYVSERSEAIARAEAYVGELGMETRVEHRGEDVYFYADGLDFSVLIIFIENGAALMTVKTSCSSEWPDFSLTLTEFAELENRNGHAMFESPRNNHSARNRFPS